MLIDTSALRNPVLDIEGWAVKDACIIHRNGSFYLYASAFFFEDGMERCHILGLHMDRLGEPGRLLFCTYGKNIGAYGLASPDIQERDGLYYLFYNTWGDKPGKPNRLLYAVSRDLVRWEFHKPLAPETTCGTRAIDATLAFANGKAYLCWKERQQIQFAYSKDIAATRWTRIEPHMDMWYENMQFIELDGVWHMLGTGKKVIDGTGYHRPFLLRMIGNPSEDASWGCWETLRLLEPPLEAFNPSELANAAFLLDYRKTDGRYYLLYAGTVHQELHAGRGDCRLGLAWSEDLEHWTINP